MSTPTTSGAHRAIQPVPAHLQGWVLPPDWRWGQSGAFSDHRHVQEVVDALGRSLALVSAPNADHAEWLHEEARTLAHSSHPIIPTTYHYWTRHVNSPRGPGYLRRWIAGETVGQRSRRVGTEGLPYMLTILRAAGSALAYLHDGGIVHGAISAEHTWVTPTGRVWLLGWQWAVPKGFVPTGLAPDPSQVVLAPELRDVPWMPTPASDQWQLAAMCFAALTGEPPPPADVPPLRWVVPEVPEAVAAIVDRALSIEPDARYPSVAALLRAVDRTVASRTLLVNVDEAAARPKDESDEARLRWATADDYEVIAPLGRGTFGSVWRVRDLALGREVALKMLHPDIGRMPSVVARFQREARLAAQLAHPALVPIYDWDSRGEVSWYTMELAEGGSVAQLVARQGPRPIEELAPQVYMVLDGLEAAHAIGIIHRDLKPENILIDRYQRWRVADFGIALAGGEETAGMTGTPAFASPEQLLGEAQGPLTDCFAIAAIAAYALTGKPPFGEDSAQAVLARQMAGDWDRTQFPEPIVKFLARALAPAPEHRFGDAAEMKAAWLEAVEETMDEASRGDSWWTRLVRSVSR
jgi:serine/threonine-protein kinase